MKASTIFSVSILVVLINYGQSVCPDLPTVANFDKEKFTGRWYSHLESADPRLPCLHYNIDIAPSGNMHFNFLPYDLNVELIPNNSNDITKGFVVLTNLANINGSSVNIFATDYSSYGGLFICNEAGPMKYHSINLLSRTQSIDQNAVNFMKTCLDLFKISHSTFQKIEQNVDFCAAKSYLDEVNKNLIPLFG